MQAVVDGLKKAQDCDSCSLTHLMQENLLAWELIQKIGPILFDNRMGVNFNAINGIMDFYQLPEKQKGALYDKILIYIEAARKWIQNGSRDQT